MCEKSVKIGHFSHVFHMVFHIHTPSSVSQGRAPWGRGNGNEYERKSRKTRPRTVESKHFILIIQCYLVGI